MWHPQDCGARMWTPASESASASVCDCAKRAGHHARAGAVRPGGPSPSNLTAAEAGGRSRPPPPQDQKGYRYAGREGAPVRRFPYPALNLNLRNETVRITHPLKRDVVKKATHHAHRRRRCWICRAPARGSAQQPRARALRRRRAVGLRRGTSWGACAVARAGPRRAAVTGLPAVAAAAAVLCWAPARA